MWLIRAFEERVIELYYQKELAGLVHVGIGQEAVAVGVAAALDDGDYLYGTHRSHGHFLARGADPSRLMAELAGRDTGYCRGRGGSMHLVDLEHRLMSATGIVGGTMPLALGTALAAREQGKVVAVYFGDGASNTGGFHESLNIAALWKLPVVMVCENNGYAEFTPMSAHTNVEHVSDHAAPYGMPRRLVDGNDLVAVHEAVAAAVKRARDGEGASMVECLTYRLRGHYVGDPASYRKAEEVEEWRQNDPLRRYTALLQKQRKIKTGDPARLESEARAVVEEAVKFALASPWPDAASLEDFVYALPRHSPPGEETSPLHRSGGRYVDALRETLANEMAADPSVIVLGEDVGVGGPFGVTAGLAERFGETRIMNTPISEDTIMGIAVGAAIAGKRPIIEIMFIDFVTLAMSQLVNHAAKLRYMSGGQLSVPMVVRLQQGALGGWGAHHSQSLEAWFQHVPGLKVVAPATAADAAELLHVAIRSDDPVLFLEHRALYYRKDDRAIGPSPPGGACIVRPGRDVTIITYSRMLHESLAAAEELAKQGIEAEVIDLRSLVPLDMDTILASVQKTNRAIVAHEAVVQGGLGAEIAARIQEAAFDDLDAPVARVGAPFTPVPASSRMEEAFVPGKAAIVESVARMLAGR